MIYQNCAGERMADYIDSVGTSYFADVPKQELLDFHYRVLNYGNERDLKDIPVTGFSADYVYRETKRASEALNGLQDKALAGYRYRHPHRRRKQQMHTGMEPRGGHGRIPRRSRWRYPVPQIF